MTAGIPMEVRAGLSRPSRLGTRRRRAPRAVPSGGGHALAGRRAPSLDTDKQLATTVSESLVYLKTEHDVRAEQVSLHRQLNATVHEIWQSHAQAGRSEEAVKWEKQWLRLHNCQSEWIGYRAACCTAYTRPVAVPIGCNHRLCPLCAWNRSSKARKRIKTLFDRLTHPVLITLTIPNTTSIRKHDFTLFRQRARKFIAQHGSWIQGGVYSLETTYNRREKTWHLHCHILADVSASLPSKQEKVELAGQRVMAFTAMKLKLEFDWLRVCGSGWGKKAKKGAGQMRRAGDDYTFEEWVAEGRKRRLKEYRPGGYVPIEGLSQSEIEARTKWNAANRRLVDLRPVIDREKAAFEVLKYITKVAAFSDLPEAVEPFSNAVKGARLIQTFGSWYGVKLDEAPDPNEPQDWGKMECSCGVNMWERMGVFYRRDVALGATGQWTLNWPLDHKSRGTVARPTIRALDAPEEEMEQLCQMQLR
jgi:hypothetical protein